MRAVRADRELQLEQELVGSRSVRVVRPPVLAAQLAELARPERDQGRIRLVAEIGLVQPIRSIEPAAREPSACELVITRDIEARTVDAPRRSLAPAPHQLGA